MNALFDYKKSILDIDSSIHECTMREKCKAVIDHGCNGQNFHLCGEVEINRGISAGCVYQKSNSITWQNEYQILTVIRINSLNSN